MALQKADGDGVLSTLAYTQLDQLLVLCLSSAAPNEADWNAWIERERRQTHTALVVSTRGGSPNAKQRAQVADQTWVGAATRPPMALLTESIAMRSMMTAFGWLFADRKAPMKAFAPEALAAALSWQNVAVQPALVQAAITRLHAALDARPAKPVVHGA